MDERRAGASPTEFRQLVRRSSVGKAPLLFDCFRSALRRDGIPFPSPESETKRNSVRTGEDPLKRPNRPIAFAPPHSGLVRRR